MMPSIYGEQQWCSLCPSFSIVLQRRKVSSAPKPRRTSEPVREVEKVRYTTSGGGGGSVGLGQNRNYEAAVYQDEDIYEETS